jgi:hypothetical protein
MEGGSTSGYFAIRMKSDVLEEHGSGEARTEEKFCVRPGLYCGLILLTDVQTGEPLALINDGYLQHLRVAADAAIGARIMARADSRILGMLGSGGMARSHVESLLRARHPAVDVYSPTRANRERFAAEIREIRHRGRGVDEPQEVYREAISRRAPLRDAGDPRAWLRQGMHVISVGGRPDDDAKGASTRRCGWAPRSAGRPAHLATTDEYLGYAARPDAPPGRIVVGKRAPIVTGRIRRDVRRHPRGTIAGRASRSRSPFRARQHPGAQFYAVAAAVARRRKNAGWAMSCRPSGSAGHPRLKPEATTMRRLSPRRGGDSTAAFAHD